MKRFLYFIIICIIALPVSAKKKKTQELYIIHSNDTHSCIYPMSPYLQDTLVAGRGGFLRRIEVLRQEREKHPDLLYIDSGDFFQGSPYFTMFKGEVELGLMNMMHLDATTIGNHEWDYGVENLANFIRRANFPVVCSNYDFTGTPLDSLVKPYIILNRNGLKIGIYALCPKLDGLVAKKNYQGVVYLNPASVGLEMATKLKKEEECDVIICISHLGWNEKADIAMIQNSRYVDLVLGGHSHTNFKDLKYVKDLDGKSVPVDQNGKSGLFLGNITLTCKKKK